MSNPKKNSAWASGLPRMSSPEVGPALATLASEATGGEIVEVGSWLGYGSAHLALGAPENRKVHVYDAFECRGLERVKAQRFGIEISLGEDTLPTVKKLLSPVRGRVSFHKGDIRSAKWGGHPISLLVDDASKQEKLFTATMHTFGGSLIDGALIALLDFYYFRTSGKDLHRFQEKVISRFSDHFETIPHSMGSTPALFRYRLGNGEFRQACREKRPLAT